MADWFTLPWKALLLRGILAISCGILAIAWPISTVRTLAVVWGIWALADGIGTLVQAVRTRSGADRFLLAAAAIVALVVALLAFTRPGFTATSLTSLLGLWLIARGSFELIGLYASRGSSRWWLLLSAGIDYLLGTLFLVNPGRDAVGLAVLLGSVAIAWGVVFLIRAFSLKDLAETTAPWIEPHSS